MTAAVAQPSRLSEAYTKVQDGVVAGYNTVYDYCPKYMHDVPVVGLVSSSFVDGFGDLIWAKPDDGQLKAAFGTAKARQDKTEIAESLRRLGKAERYVQSLVESMTSESLDFQGFKELVLQEKPQKNWIEKEETTGYNLPVPNVEKILDVPIIGSTLNAAGSLVNQPVGTLVRGTCAPSASDEKLEKVFKDLDTDGSGKLNLNELGGALRNLWFSEFQIKEKLKSVTGELSCYEFKKFVRGPKYEAGYVNSVPLVGPSLSAHFLNVLDKGVDELDEKDLKEAFDHIDKNKDGKLDKTEMGDVLRELGQSELQIEKLLADVPNNVEMDFQAFKESLPPKSRDYLNWYGRIPYPNIAKIHDVPFVGTVTEFTQDLVTDVTTSTVGSAWGAVRKYKDEDIKACFDAEDKNKDGKLDKKELAKALRGLELYESDIKMVQDGCGDLQQVSFIEFSSMVRNEGRWVFTR